MEISQYSDQGGREYNEDTCIVLREAGRVAAIIADGLGGHGKGEQASRAAAESLKEDWRQNGGREITKEKLDLWMHRANEKVLAMQTPTTAMKTTVVFLCIDEKRRKAQWAHAGDSRLYYFADYKQTFCTFDHSVSRMAALVGEIDFESIRFHQDRNRLLRTIGMEELPETEQGQCILEKNTAHAFLLCTDGFWEYVEEEDMERSLVNSGTAEEWIDRMRQILRSKIKDGNDNNSAIAVWIS